MQEHGYEDARKSYAQVEKLVKEMSGGEEEFRTAMKNFDILLQCILYRGALADKKYEKAEAKFLEDITNFDDVPQLVRVRSPFKRAMLRMNKKKRAAFDAELDSIADGAANAFVTPFAVVDAKDTGRDFLAEIERELLNIFLAFAAADGDDLAGAGTDVDNELGALASRLGEYLTAKWELIVSDWSSR